MIRPPFVQPSSQIQFGLDENIPGPSFERRAYLFGLKTARVVPIPTGRVERG